VCHNGRGRQTVMRTQEVRLEVRFHSPYRRWALGLITEIVVFALFMAAVALIALLAAWMA